MVASQGTAQSGLEAHSCICSACCSTAETWWLISGTEPLDHQSKKVHLHCESAGAGKGVSNTSISTLHSQNHPNTCDISACKLAQGWLFALPLLHCGANWDSSGVEHHGHKNGTVTALTFCLL